MVTVTFVSHDGIARTVEASAGMSLMEAAKSQDIPGIAAVCGGNCYCGTCRVEVPAEWLARLQPAESFEIELIAETSGIIATSRLSCQIPLDDSLDGLIVHTPAEQF